MTSSGRDYDLFDRKGHIFGFGFGAKTGFARQRGVDAVSEQHDFGKKIPFGAVGANADNLPARSSSRSVTTVPQMNRDSFGFGLFGIPAVESAPCRW